jgi:hypothetical protein
MLAGIARAVSQIGLKRRWRPAACFPMFDACAQCRGSRVTSQLDLPRWIAILCPLDPKQVLKPLSYRLKSIWSKTSPVDWMRKWNVRT